VFTPRLAPIGDSLLMSSLVALLSLVTVFVTLGVLKWKAYWAAWSAR
jgi:lactate permease